MIRKKSIPLLIILTLFIIETIILLIVCISIINKKINISYIQEDLYKIELKDCKDTYMYIDTQKNKFSSVNIFDIDYSCSIVYKNNRLDELYIYDKNFDYAMQTCHSDSKKNCLERLERYKDNGYYYEIIFDDDISFVRLPLPVIDNSN